MTSLLKEEKNAQLLKLLQIKLEKMQREKFHDTFSKDPATLYKELLKHKRKLDQLLAKRVIRKDQYDLLLPQSKLTNAAELDSTLLHLLLRTFCGYQEPSTGWNSEPLSTDRSVIANLIRLKIGRNKICHTSKVADTVYKTVYNYIRQSLLELGCTKDELDNLSPPPISYYFIPATPSFVGRKNEIKALHSGLKNTKNLNGVLGFVISGLSGVGKTELAKKYFEIHSSYFNENVVWVNAESEATLQQSFETLATTLSLHVTDDQGNFLSIETIIKEVHNYFYHDRVLFVFDNVDSNRVEVRNFIPQSTGCYTLITSQNKFWSKHFNILHLDVLTVPTAIQFFKNEIADDVWLDTVQAIVEQVQCHPLALQQIVSYIQQNKTSIATYASMLEKQLGSLLANSVSVGKNKLSVMATFNIALDKVKAEKYHALVLELLNTMCYLDGKEIRMGYLLHLGYGDKSNVVQSTIQITNALNAIEKYSIINITMDSQNINDNIITMHSLVQEAIKQNQKELRCQTECFYQVLQGMLENFNDLEASKYKYKHLIYIYEKQEFEHEFLLTCKNYMDIVTNTLSNYGKIREAEAILTSLEIMLEKERHFNEDLLFEVKLHIVECKYISYKDDEAFSKLKSFKPSKYNHSNIHWKFQLNWAKCLFVTGKFSEALQYYQQACEFNAQNASKINLLTVDTKCFMAFCLQHKGRIDEALAIYREVYKIRCQLFGEHHPRILSIKRDIANLLSKKGKIDEALAMHGEVYRTEVQLLGERHPSVLTTKYIMANCLSDKGQFDEALTMYKEAYEIQVELLGERHRDVLHTKHNTAKSLSDKGQTDEALTMYKEVYKVRVELFGERHPDVLTTKHNIANLLSDRGQIDEALTMSKEVYKVRVELFGERHPDVLTTKHNIANLLSDKGQIDEALAMYKEVYEIRVKLFDKRHFDVLRTKCSIANRLSDKGQIDEALTIYKEAYEVQVELFGERHSDVLTTKGNIANLLLGKGQVDRALTMYKEVYDILVKMFGERHPHILNTKYGIGCCLCKEGKTKKALKLFQDVLNIRLEILGAEHYLTAKAQKAVTYCIQREEKC